MHRLEHAAFKGDGMEIPDGNRMHSDLFCGIEPLAAGESDPFGKERAGDVVLQGGICAQFHPE